MVSKVKSISSLNQPTMYDVAAAAGVSQMTVSRVMRAAGYVSDDVRARVLAAADAVGYVHNKSARGGGGYSNPLVGVVLPTLQNRVFTEVFAGVNETLSRNKFRPVFGVSNYSQKEEEEIVLDLMSWRPTGLIITGLEHTAKLREIIGRSGVRSVEIMDVDGAPMGGCCGFSHYDAGTAMARHAIEKGYRSAVYAGSQGGADLRAEKRLNGFRDLFTQSGGRICDVVIADGPSSMALGRQMTKRILETRDGRDLIYFSNDDLAGGGVMHCIAEGVSVPDEIALCGFNGLPFLDALPVTLTTTRTPRFDIGRQAADLIASTVKAERGEDIIQLPTVLVAGDTT